MLKFEVKAEGFDRALQKLAGYDQIAAQENRSAMQKSVSLVERYAKQVAPVGAVGELRAKITGEVRAAGPGQVVGVVGSYARHGIVVEEGADPHWPNITSLSLWVQRKLQVSQKELKSVTFLIARAISRAGLTARPYLSPSFKKAQSKIKGFFRTALKNIVRRLAR